MNRYIYIVAFSFIAGVVSGQDIFPKPNSVINYTQVLFQAEPIDYTARYRFLVADSNGDFNDPLFERWDSTHVTLIDDLNFANRYSWKTEAYDENGILISESPVHFFSIGKILSVDSSSYRFPVYTNTGEFSKKEVVFLDYNGVAINREGKPVWYLPPLGRGMRSRRLRDLKMTDDGTLTLVTVKKCIEFTLEGKIIWSTPGDGIVSGDTTEYYHHEFTKLPNGNYSVLGKRSEENKLLKDLKIDKIPFTVAIEYNSNGDTLWTWNSRDIISDDDLLKYGNSAFFGDTYGHANSLVYSEDGKLIYISFRGLNSVVVINRDNSQPLACFGDSILSFSTAKAIGFFRKQHSAIPLKDGGIVVFNNNDPGKTSSVVVFTAPLDANTPSEITWEFECDFDSLAAPDAERMGNVVPMVNGNYLVNMGRVARLFEVTPEKEVIWNCIPEKWNSDSSFWEPLYNYRLSFQSSLHPKYFSVSLKKDPEGKRYFLIHNEGSEEDSYTINLLTRKKQKKLEVALKADHSARIYPENYLSKKELKRVFNIQVESRTNQLQHYERSISLH